MKKLKSSWNEDRIAAAFCNRSPQKGATPRTAKPAVRCEIDSDRVTVFTKRGRKVFSRQFGDMVYSTCICGNELEVETMNGSIFVCNVRTGKLLETHVPSESSDGSADPDASAVLPHIEWGA